MATSKSTSLGKRKRSGNSEGAGPNKLQYARLKDSEIRLVRFGRGSTHPDVISMRLESFELEQTPPFLALSYVWGDKHKTVPVDINSQDFHVTENLYQALKQIKELSGIFEEGLSRDLDGDRAELYLWIDAISINQDDAVEKSAHVPNISSMYAKAFTTLVWFGTFDTMKSNPDQLGLKLLLNQLDRSVPLEDFKAPPWEPGVFLGTRDIGDITQSMIQAYRDILTNEWFERVWVVQEYALSQRDPCALIGRAMFSFRALYFSLLDFMELFKVEYEPIRVGLARFVRAFGDYLTQSFGRTYMGVELTSDNFQNKPFADQLMWLLLRLLGKQCTVPHDRIYGLLGMLDLSKLPPTLTPDYQKPYDEVCADYTRFLVENTGDLRILTSGQAKWLQGQPNWVMDFRYLGRYKIEPGVLHTGSFSQDGLALNVKGIRAGHMVDEFQVGLEVPSPHTLQSEKLSKVLQEAQEIMMRFYETFIHSVANLQRRSVSEAWKDWFSYFLTEICRFPEGEGEQFDSAEDFFYHDNKGEDHRLYVMEVLCQFLDRHYLLMDDGTVAACMFRRPPQENEKFEIYALRGSVGYTIVLEGKAGEYQYMGTCNKIGGDETFDEEFFARSPLVALRLT